MVIKGNLLSEIERLKKERNAIILAHNYQIDQVQDLADFVGDSFKLSQQAAATDAELIVFCGVIFMAESAKILSPDKTVLLPEKMADCPMANMVDVPSLKEMKKRYPEAAVVAYVNSPAAVKAESDICCTSSNARQVVESLPQEQIIFLPDQNLGQYVASQTTKELIIWEGYCSTHARVRPEEVKKAKAAHPQAPLLIHPECTPEVLALADYIGSTAGILDYARESKASTFLIGTEMGIIHRLQKENPDKRFYLLSPGLICPNMKKTTLEKVYLSLKELITEIELPAEIREKAYRAMSRMLQIS